MSRIEISKTKIPRIVWLGHIMGTKGKKNVEVLMMMKEDITNNTYLPEAVIRHADGREDFLSLPGNYTLNDRVKIEEKLDDFMDSVTEKYGRGGGYFGAEIEKIVFKAQDIEGVLKEIQESGAFNINTEKKKEEIKVEQQPEPISTLELDELIVKFKPQELRAMVDKMTVEKLKIKYGEEAIKAFLEKIKYV